MESISNSAKKKDHDDKINGWALYVDDYEIEGLIHGKLLHSIKARARIIKINLPELPEGYFVVDKNDVDGTNRVKIVQEDMPVFAEDTVEYVGEPILMVVGPNIEEIERILQEIVVVYEELNPVLDMRESDDALYQCSYEKGDIERSLQEAEHVFVETFETGYQEHAYLEPQGIIAYTEERRMTVLGSLQCPYYVHGALCKALGCDENDVRVIQSVTGGAFGGKEDFPSLLACQTAVAARKSNKPVKVIFDRHEDIAYTSKRHPSVCTYKIAVKDKKIIGMDIEVIFNSGAYTTLTPVVLQRGIISAGGVYTVDNLRVKGRAMKTNTVPCGAFRGFGAPQTFFAVEMMMSHTAKKMGIDPLEFKKKYLAYQGDTTSTSGKYHFHIPLPEMIKQIEVMSDYQAKYKAYKNQKGRYRRGIGIALVFHGCGFTGSAERDYIKAVVKIAKKADDTVEILTSNTDMGQGLKTTFCKIVADTLGLPYARVLIENPDTDRVPDSGPTVASRSTMIVGQLLLIAAEKLKKEWRPGEEQVIEEKYREPDFMIPFNYSNFKGDAYPTYSWAVQAVEVEVDTLTAVTNVLGAWGVFDVGVPIDLNIIQGQVQGGFLQGIGYASMEQMSCNYKGVILNSSFSDYLIPTAADVPNIKTEIIHNPYPNGPYGAKGAGELPAVGAAPAYLEAMENALETDLNKVPFTQENTMSVLQEVLNNDKLHS